MTRNGGNISSKTTLRLDRGIMEIDSVRDKMKLSNTIKNLTILDIRSLNKYITELEPGIDFKTVARIPGGGSVDTFLRINKNFFWPDL